MRRRRARASEWAVVGVQKAETRKQKAAIMAAFFAVYSADLLRLLGVYGVKVYFARSGKNINADGDICRTISA